MLRVYLWGWDGKFFGYRDGDTLWTVRGQHVGRFKGNEVFDADGFYLGEIRQGKRLITHELKRNRREGRFTPELARTGLPFVPDEPSLEMWAGYTAFPALEER